MFEFRPTAGTLIGEACEMGVRLAAFLKQHCEANEVPENARVALTKGVPTEFLGFVTGMDWLEAFDHFRAMDKRAFVLLQNLGGDDGVRFDFNDLTVVALASSDPRDIEQRWWSADKARTDAYWTPERKAEAARRDAVRAKEVRSQRVRIAEIRGRFPLAPNDANAWADEIEKNSDPYGACVYEYAQAWAALMEAEIKGGAALKDIAEETSRVADSVYGITGFQYGCAVSILSRQWKHGEELRVWHNLRTHCLGVVGSAVRVVPHRCLRSLS